MTHISQPPQNSAAGVPGEEIEITPEMIWAGVECYLRHCPDTGVGDEIDRRMVRQIFEAMLTVAGRVATCDQRALEASWSAYSPWIRGQGHHAP